MTIAPITSSAVAAIADRTANDVRYSYRPLSGIAVISISIYLFRVSNGSFFSCLSAFRRLSLSSSSSSCRRP